MFLGDGQSPFMIFMELLIAGLAVVLIPMAIHTYRILKEKE